MPCKICENSYPEKDMMGDFCYKCLYKNKLLKNQQIIQKCGVCGKELPKGKWKYCSNACSMAKAKERNGMRWTRTITSVSITWKG